MSLATSIQNLFPSVDRPGNLIRDVWDRITVLPGGKRLFSKLVGQMAPYTGSMGAEVVELCDGYSRVVLTDRREVRNHLRCVHAIALANLAELTGNIAVAYALPDDARFIVAGMSIDYIKKARGTITGECNLPFTLGSEKKTYEVPVSLRDPSGVEVARATLQTLVGPKKRLD